MDIAQPITTEAKPKRKYNYTRKTGRPSKFAQIDMEQLRKIVMLGATDKQIADFFGMSKICFDKYKQNKKEFLYILKQFKEEWDKRVEDSLVHRAIGYSHQAVEFFVIKGKIVEKKYIKHYPPDSTAMIFWLKNRKPAEWRDRHEHEHGGNINFNLTTLLDNVNQATNRSGKYMETEPAN